MPLTKRCVAVRGACRAWLGTSCAWLAVWLTVLSTGRAVAQKPPQGPASQPMKAAEIHQGPLQIKRTFVGTVVPRRVSQVGSTVEGRVIELCVEEGDHVAKGDRLAQLRTTSLKIDLASAEAELELLQAERDRLQVAGPEEIKQAKARIEAAEALMALTNSRRARGARPSMTTVISQDELDELISADTAASSVLKERTIGWELAKVTLPIDVARAEAKIEVQREKIRGLEDDIAEHTILAPFDGYVAEEHTEVGQWIAEGGLVAEVVELAKVDVKLPVLETYVSQLQAKSKREAGTKEQEGTKVLDVQIEALPEEETEEQEGTKALDVQIEALPEEEFDGEVVSIVPKANLSARTFPVNVRLKNRSGPDGVLPKPGMLARVTLPLGTIPNALLVPKDALVLGRTTITIWVIRKEADFEQSRLGSASPILVATGEKTGEWTQVLPLTADGEALLQPGARDLRGERTREPKAAGARDRGDSPIRGGGNKSARPHRAGSVSAAPTFITAFPCN